MSHYSFNNQLQNLESLPGYSAFYPQLDHQQPGAAIKASVESGKAASHTEKNTTDIPGSSGDSPETNLGASCGKFLATHGKQTDEEKKTGAFNQHAIAKDGENDE